MQQQPDRNEKGEGSFSIRDELSDLVSTRDELSEAKARQDAIRDVCLKTEMELEDLLSPVVDLAELMHEKVDFMKENKKVLETIENMDKYVTDQWYPMKIEMQRNIIRLREDELSKRINKLNDDKNMLSELEDDVKREEKEKFDLEALIEATEDELLKQRDIRKGLSSSTSTLLKEISEREAEYRHLENEFLNLEEKVDTENVELQALRHKKNINAQNIIAQEVKYRNQLAMREQLTSSINDYKETFDRKLAKNQKIMLNIELIEKEREQDMEKLNLIINQNQDVYVQRQNDYKEITNKMISEFGDVESFPQMILEAKAKLAKFSIDCQTINSTFDAKCQKETEIEKRELTLLAKQAELKRKLDQKVLEKMNVWITQNLDENGSIASSSAALNQNNAVKTEHGFVQPQVVPNRNIPKIKKTRSKPPQQTTVKVALNVADTTSTASNLSLTPPEVSYADDRRFRSWKALQWLRENDD